MSASFVSGVDDFDTYLAGNPTHTVSSIGNEWLSSSTAPQTLTYDLGAVFEVDRFAGWFEDSFSVLSADLSFSEDGNSFTDLGTINPFNNPFASYPAEAFSTAFVGRFFRMEITSCDTTSGNFCGFGEIAFSVSEPSGTAPVPLPAPVLLLLAGLGALGAAGRRAGAA